MKRLSLAIALLLLGAAACLADPPNPTFRKVRLTDKFYCEGAYYADFNKDGHLDVVAGPFWYEGPDFQKKHEIRPPRQYDPKGYSDNFLTYTGDFNGDGWPDVLYVPMPGEDAYWYENPGTKGGPWKKHLAVKDLGNESPLFADINGDGRPELIYNVTGYMGYATYDPAKPDEPWKFHPVTPKGNYQRYTHGIGYGDINGDGRIDIVESTGWWEHPAQDDGGPWVKHPYQFAEAGAQMAVYDVDGDGLADVITAWHCHLYGLVWHQQVRGANGQITWKKHIILPPNPDLKSKDLRISQLHALDLADMNGDGLKDIVTGKRFWAHGPHGDAEPNAPAMLYWFELRRDKQKGVTFIPHQIDDDSGVGTQVTAVDLNGDGIPDVIVGNKKGVFLFLSEK
ncbi:MAG: FG-GAP repeat domain-containing protein [Thermoguttaceae bacterium]